MILGLILMVVANAGAIIAAWAVFLKVRTGRPSLDAVVFLLLHIGILSAAVLAAGCLRLLSPVPLGAAGLMALLAWRWKGRGLPLPRFARPRLGRAGAALVVFVAVRILLQVWFLAPNLPDVLTYHLPKVAEWVRAGAFTSEVGLDPRSWFPAGFELLETWWVVFLWHDVLIEMAGVEFLLLAAVSVYAIARQLGLRTRTAALAGCFYAAMPGPALQAVSCMNDGAVAALLLATAALVSARTHVGLPLLAAGLGLGIKGTYGYAALGLLLLAWFSRSAPPTRSRSSRAAVWVAVAGLAIGASWYGRNLVLHGNPIYPVTSKGFVARSGAVLQQAGPRLSSLSGNVRALADERIHEAKSPSVAQLAGQTGWGALVYSLGGVCLAALLARDAGFRRWAAALFLSAASAFLFTLPDPWSMRFILHVPALFCAAAAAVIPSSRWLGGIAALALLADVVPSTLPGDLYEGQLRELVGSSWRDRANRVLKPPMPPGGALGVLDRGERLSYVLYRPDYSVRVVYLRGRSPGDLVEEMDRRGIRVVWSFPETDLAADCVARGLLVRVGEAVYVRPVAR